MEIGDNLGDGDNSDMKPVKTSIVTVTRIMYMHIFNIMTSVVTVTYDHIMTVTSITKDYSSDSDGSWFNGTYSDAGWHNGTCSDADHHIGKYSGYSGRCSDGQRYTSLYSLTCITQTDGMILPSASLKT